MASRELRYTISGDTRDFTRAMQSVDKRLAASEKNAGRVSRGFASALGGIGSAATAAGVAIGAGLVIEAKRSVQAFQESNKVARQTQAVLKSTGGAANVTAKEVSNLSQALSRKTGIDDEVVQSGQNMLLTFTNIRNEAGKGNKIFDQATKVLLDMSTALGQDASKSAIQLGKALNDPVKGITALRRVGVAFTEEQQKQIDTLVKSGKTVEAQRIILAELRKEFAGSAAAQATSTAKLSVAFGNLEEDIGSGLAPAVDAIANKLTHFAHDVEPDVIRAADRIAKAFGRKDLSLDQQFRLSFQEARKIFEPLAREGGTAIQRMHIGDKLGDAFEAAIPKIADTLAEHAPQVAGRFVNAFFDAGIWGRLVIGGFLLKKLGGLGAFQRLGAQAGGAFATGMATTAAGGAVGAATGRGRGGLGGKLRGVGGAGLAALGGPVGIAAGSALVLGPELLKPFTTGSKKVSDALDEIDRKARKASNGGLESYRNKLREVARTARESANQGNKADAALATGVERLAERANNALGAQWQGSIRRSWRNFQKSGTNSLEATDAAVRRNMTTIKQRIGQDTEAGRKAMAANFRQAANAVQTQMDRSGGATKKGTAQIRSYLVEALKSLGLSGAQAQAKVTTGTLQGGNARTPGQGLAPTRAGGGWIGQRGQRGQDTVPVLMGAGEAVLNRHQQAVIEGYLGGGFLDKLFSRVQTPHYLARGGRIPDVTVVSPRGGAGALAQRAVDVDRSQAQRIYDRRAAAQAASGAGGAIGRGVSGSIHDAIAFSRNIGAWTFSAGQLTGGNHAQGSYHYSGRAADFGHAGHSEGEMRQLYAAFKRHFGSNIRELFYDPMGEYIKNGRVVSGAIGGHSDHLHIALARGGRLPRFARGGGLGKSISGAEWPALWGRAWDYLAPKMGMRGRAAPALRFNNAGGYEAQYWPNTHTVDVGPVMRRALSHASGYQHDFAIETLAHELAHAGQAHGGRRLSKAETEGGATRFAFAHAAGLARALGLNYGGATNGPDGYGKYVRRTKRMGHGRNWVDRGQFGLKPKRRRRRPGGGGTGFDSSDEFVVIDGTEYTPDGLEITLSSPGSGMRRFASGGRLGYNELASLWVRAGGPKSKAGVAAAIALAESSGNPSAINTSNGDGSVDRGLWQINSVHGAMSTTDILGNARAAVAVSGGGRNFSPWTQFTNGAYRRFLHGAPKLTGATGGLSVGGGGRARGPGRAVGKGITAHSQVGRGRSAGQLLMDQAGNIDLAAALAEGTADTADDAAVRGRQAQNIQARMQRLAIRLMGSMPAGKRRKLLAQYASLQRELNSVNEASASAAQLPDVSEEDTTQQEILAALQAMKETNQQIAAELATQNARADRLGQTQNGVIAQWVTEVISGNIATGAVSGARTPGYAGQRF